MTPAGDMFSIACLGLNGQLELAHVVLADIIFKTASYLL